MSSNLGWHRKQRKRTVHYHTVDMEAGCYYCGYPATTVDHIIPVAYAGSRAHHPDNLVPACHRCNVIASDFIFETLDEKRDYIVTERRPEILRDYEVSCFIEELKGEE